MDAYAGVSRGVEQITVRASRRLSTDPERTVVGPMRYEVVEPMRSVRFVPRAERTPADRVRLAVRGGGAGRSSRTAPIIATATACRPTSCATTRSAWPRAGSRSTASAPRSTRTTWVSTRDHSWGVRYDVGTAADRRRSTVDPLDGLSFRMIWCPMLMERPDGTRYGCSCTSRSSPLRVCSTRSCMGGVEHPDGRVDRWTRSSPSLRYDPANRRLRGGRIHATTESRHDPHAADRGRVRHRLPPRRRPLLRVRRSPPRRMAGRPSRRGRAHRRLLRPPSKRAACTRSATRWSTSSIRKAAVRVGATVSRSSPAATRTSASPPKAPSGKPPVGPRQRSGAHPVVCTT